MWWIWTIGIAIALIWVALIMLAAIGVIIWFIVRRKRRAGKTTRMFWLQPSFWAWVIMAVFVLATVPGVTMVFAKHIVLQAYPFIPLWIFGTASGLLVFLTLAFWLKKCFSTAGTPEVPHQVILVRFGRPTTVVPEGLFFKFVPFEKVKRVPTGQYSFSYVISEGLYSKEKDKLRSQPLKVDITVYFRFPRADRTYRFPEEPKVTTEAEMPWKEVSGAELLKGHLFYRLPVPNLMAVDAIQRMGDHFAGAVIGGVRHVLSTKNSQQCKEAKRPIEREIKTYLLQEQGNPFFEIGIPEACLDIELTSVKLPEETEKAYIKPEIARKDAEAAKHQQTTIKRKLDAYIKGGISPDIAGVLTAGSIEGKSMTIEQLRDLAFIRSLLQSPIPGPVVSQGIPSIRATQD